ncbi:S-glutathionyl-(chloro)hydroquinone reductase [Tulasnella sp. JGI-2019a]|nr:S-glutathionyl-(chloro)hydroquinone reductase [Tulasnella sp. JGI-2019a]
MSSSIDWILATALVVHNLGCPWANRATIVRQLKGLQDFIGITVVSPVLTAKGWAFQKAAEKEVAGTEDDPLNGCSHIREYYLKVNPEYDGRCDAAHRNFSLSLTAPKYLSRFTVPLV